MCSLQHSILSDTRSPKASSPHSQTSTDPLTKSVEIVSDAHDALTMAPMHHEELKELLAVKSLTAVPSEPPSQCGEVSSIPAVEGVMSSPSAPLVELVHTPSSQEHRDAPTQEEQVCKASESPAVSPSPPLSSLKKNEAAEYETTVNLGAEIKLEAPNEEKEQPTASGTPNIPSAPCETTETPKEIETPSHAGRKKRSVKEPHPPTSAAEAPAPSPHAPSATHPTPVSATSTSFPASLGIPWWFGYAERTPPDTPRHRSPSPAHEDALPSIASQELMLKNYRELHHQRFRTRGEELSFLRSHFVTSRKRLLYLHDYTKQLKRSLQQKTEECAMWKTNAEEGAKKMAKLTGGSTTTAAAANPAEHRPSSALWLFTPTRAGPPAAAAAAASSSSQPVAKSSSVPKMSWRGTGIPRDSEASLRRTAESEARLVQELRKNLARRDTDLEALQLEHKDVCHLRFALERDLRSTKLELRKCTDQLNQLQQTLAEKEKTLDMLEEAGKAHLEEKTALLQTVAELKDQIDLMELLRKGDAREPPSARRRPRQRRGEEEGLLHSDTDEDGDRDERRRDRRGERTVVNHFHSSSSERGSSRVVVLDSPSTDATIQMLRQEVKSLQKQLSFYRDRWQRSEEELEEMVARLRKQQLGEPNAEGSPATARPLSASSEAYARELHLQQEDLSRLQRRLERQQDAANHREEQLLQDKMNTERLHRQAIHRLQEMLEEKENKIRKAEDDRENAVARLRHSVEDGKLKEVLQQQRDTLQQRVHELSKELLELRGHEKEIQLAMQAEVASKLQVAREKSELELELQHRQHQEKLLQQEIQLLSQKVGESEGRAVATQKRLEAVLQQYPLAPTVEAPHGSAGAPTGASQGKGSAPPSEPEAPVQVAPVVPAPPPSTVCLPDASLHRNPQAVASELKGYAALMAINSQQQRRMSELEAELCRTTRALEELQSSSPTSPSSLPSNEEGASPRLVELRGSLYATIERLEEQLKVLRKNQLALYRQAEALKAESSELVRDNYVLAEGAERLIHRMARWHAKKAGEEAAAVAPHSSRCGPRQRIEHARGLADQQEQLSSSTVERAESSKPTSSHLYAPPVPSVSMAVVNPPASAKKKVKFDVAQRAGAPPPPSSTGTNKEKLTEVKLRKALRQARKEIGEYEQLLALLDASGQLDAWLGALSRTRETGINV